MNIVGHKNNQQILQKFFRSQKLPHALLFSGSAGIGKASLARIWSQLLLCSGPVMLHGYQPCGTCKNCQMVQKNNHPDLIWLEPEEKSSLNLDQVKTLIEAAQYHPVLANRRVLVVNEAQSLREDAQNSLLKTIEELPERDHLILVAHQREKILLTVLSRVIELRFQSLAPTEVQKILENIIPDYFERTEIEPFLFGSLAHIDQLRDMSQDTRQKYLAFLSFLIDQENSDAYQWQEWLLGFEREDLLWLSDFTLFFLHQKINAECQLVSPNVQRIDELRRILERMLNLKKHLVHNGNLSLVASYWVQSL